MTSDFGHLADGLRILAADEDRAALERTAGVLERLGHFVTASAIDLAEATEAVAREDPDLAIVVVHDDDEHALALIEEIGAFCRGPVIALVIDDDPGFARRAADRGIYACAQDLDPESLQAAIEVAMRRHAETERLVEQVDRLESALERRARIERAKGILMERHGIAEREAFEVLRSHARSRSRPVVHVAEAVIEGHGLLPTGTGGRPDSA
jgi:AmiR/NasT family two-component response regulator